MYIPHTEEQKKEMLKVIGVKSFDDLLTGLPPSLLKPHYKLPNSLSEMELVRHMEKLASKNELAQSYLGAGAYEHYIPASVWPLTLRGEFATAYTPYQPEASQGTLQSIYEFQTLICELFGMDVANASMYEGSSSAAEACLTAAHHTGKTEIIVPKTVHPHTRQVIDTYLKHSGAKLKTIDCPEGILMPESLEKNVNADTAAVLIQNPNFFGCLESVHALSDITHKAGALLIASSYPVSLGLITPPGEFNADIAVAEGQPLGLPLSHGGPYVGLFACKKELMRKMPGRIAGQTLDLDGKRGFVLTLQAREQHIRREKATSNICTNQALCALASTIYMALLGKEGLRELANLNFQKAHYAARQLEKQGFLLTFKAPFFNEFAIRCPKPPKELIEKLSKEKILAGHPLETVDSALRDSLLICVTEIKTKQDIDNFINRLSETCREWKTSSGERS